MKKLKRTSTKNLRLKKEEYITNDFSSLEVCIKKREIPHKDWTSIEYPDEVQKIRDFDFNPDNAYKCDGCPHNRNYDNWQGRYPCGQWNCWVVCSCPYEF